MTKDQIKESCEAEFENIDATLAELAMIAVPGSVQNIFASQEVFRDQVSKFKEDVDLVSGEVGGEIFVLEAA